MRYQSSLSQDVCFSLILKQGLRPWNTDQSKIEPQNLNLYNNSESGNETTGHYICVESFIQNFWNFSQISQFSFSLPNNRHCLPYYPQCKEAKKTRILPVVMFGFCFSQLSSVQLLSCARLFATPWSAACQASLSITNSWSLLKLMSIELVMPSNHLILCRSLLPPSIFPNLRVFSNESVLCIRWLKDWSFSFNISPSNEHSGMISFRMDWLDLIAVQGTLKRLLQHHSSKASIFKHSAFFIVQLSHPYMTTGKTIALTSTSPQKETPYWFIYFVSTDLTTLDFGGRSQLALLWASLGHRPRVLWNLLQHTPQPHNSYHPEVENPTADGERALYSGCRTSHGSPVG